MVKALATFTTYVSYPALDCLSQNFVQCGQAITVFGLPMWQAEADTELILSTSPVTAVGQILLNVAKFC